MTSPLFASRLMPSSEPSNDLGGSTAGTGLGEGGDWWSGREGGGRWSSKMKKKMHAFSLHDFVLFCCSVVVASSFLPVCFLFVSFLLRPIRCQHLMNFSKIKKIT